MKIINLRLTLALISSAVSKFILSVKSGQSNFLKLHRPFIQQFKYLHNNCFCTARRQKDFDKVWHEALLFELINLPFQLLNIIRYFLNRPTFQIIRNGSPFSSRLIKTGISQGFCISLQLFNIYINDMPPYPSLSLTRRLNRRYNATSIVATPKILQEQINITEKWFNDQKISINTYKTKAVKHALFPLFNKKKFSNHQNKTTMYKLFIYFICNKSMLNFNTVLTQFYLENFYFG